MPGPGFTYTWQDHFDHGKHNEAFHWFVSAYLLDKNNQPAKEGMRKCLQKTGDKELLELYRPYLSEQPQTIENQK